MIWSCAAKKKKGRGTVLDQIANPPPLSEWGANAGKDPSVVSKDQTHRELNGRRRRRHNPRRRGGNESKKRKSEEDED